MEPYWNPVRTDQVKGRAVRICSHIDLNYSEIEEENERTVEVFTYCSTFAPEALLHPDGSTGYGRIDMTVISGDGMKPTEAVKMGLPVLDGVKDYVITSDEYLYALSENKKKLLQNIQNLMKTSAVDCEINRYENEEDGLGCITIPGNPEQYAYHPNLQKDIAETSTRFKEQDFAQPLAAAPAAAQANAAAPNGAKAAQANAAAPNGAKAAPAEGQVLAKQKKTIKAQVITIGDKQYIASPVKSASGSVLSYDLFSRSDIQRVKKVGTLIADAQGNLTEDYTLF
jgi:hypothetical protein